ncbi:MAG: ABC transporter permease [Bosea sp.]|uniref:ABC transporter permease n=1 Tax=Bosea sp. (in: a-proteobacteria) TaxID=1871050 RepID=UPI001AC1B920|nr:ABC transporter permease [Bosea sp. (in: a-proteobacteria)]MBN9451320.1 ABC transporter permease [Bosea sp. (in: a-proteobacteria)]
MSTNGFGNISIMTRSMAWLIVCFLVLPITIVFAVSVTDKHYLSLPEQGISFQYYEKLFTSGPWMTSILQSFVIACASTVAAVLLGTLCAIGCWRLGNRASDFVRMLMLVPIMVPTIVYALGIYQFWIDLRLLDSYTGLIIAHIVTGLPYVVITVSTALAGFDPRLEQASLSLGASIGQTLRLVIIPNIKPGVISGAIFAFIHSWDELVLALFIAGRAVFTLPRRMWDGINESLDPTMAAVAAVLIAITVSLLCTDAYTRSRRA